MTGRYLLVAFLALHGLVHVLGFSATWRIGPTGTVSAAPSLLPAVASGGAPAHLLGIMWLAASIAFIAAALGLMGDAAWWRTATAAAALVSLGLSVAWWTDAKAGALIDVAILVMIVASALSSPAAAV